MPKVDECNWYADIAGGQKYRPTFIAMMSKRIGVPPFEDPKACKTEIDVFGEPGDRQDYSESIYVCPSVHKWTDERNGSYGYNYQFLGNSRLTNPADVYSFKNWPVQATRIRVPAETVAVGDCMGTAASYPKRQHGAYVNNSRDSFRFGNEGFNLDPPRVDPVNGEMAGLDEAHRTAADPRHRGRSNILWLDGHADPQTLEDLGYAFNADGSIGFEGNNRLWSGSRKDRAWTAPEQAD
jgi:prepilin-type processing-associated H-X9-DG protein